MEVGEEALEPLLLDFLSGLGAGRELCMLPNRKLGGAMTGMTLPRRKYGRLALLVAPLGTLVALVLVPQASATYPGHNGLIAFNAVTGGQNQIYTVRPNGHDLRQITHVDGDAAFADWSPDGSKIVFELDTADRGTVALMNADGSGLTDLTPLPVCCSGQ